MLEGLIRFSIRQRIIIFLGVAGLFAGGIWAYTHLPIEAFPDVLNNTVMVITQVPGQSAEDIERKITMPLEREFSGIPKVIQSRSISEFGLSVIYLYFDDDADKYWARSQTLEKIGTAPLPNGVTPTLAPLASVTGEVYRYELKGSGYSSKALRTIQDWTLEKQFRSVPGVADVTSYGGRVRTWDVLIDPLKLATYDLTIKQVSDAVANSNGTAGGNLISWPNQSFVVRAEGQFKTMNDVLEVGITRRGNAIIRIRDIGAVVDSFQPPRGVVGRDDRDDIVQGIILLRKGDNPVETGRKIVEKMTELRSGTLLPEGVHLETYYDRLQLVAKTTKTVGKNLAEGLILVAVILFLFLKNVPATLLVCAVVPLSMSFAFLMMTLTHTPANLVSLGAIDFGIMVDGAVIMVEYILAKIHRKEILSLGETNFERTIVEVVRPIFVSMLMIIVAYLPILTLQRVEGKMFGPLAWTITFALSGALLLSISFVPSLIPVVARYEFEHPHHDPAWFTRLFEAYKRGLDWVFANTRRFGMGVLGLAAIGLVVFKFSGSEFLPELDEGALWIRATYPHSMSLAEGTKLAHRIRGVLRSMPEVKTVVSQLGGPEDGTDPNLFDNCEFFADLKARETWKRFHHDREEFFDYVRRELARIPGIDFTVSQPIADNVEEAISGVKGKNAAKIFGPDLVVLNHIADELVRVITSVRGTADVGKIASSPQVPHLTVTLDRARVAQAGLAFQDIDDLVEIAVGGKAVTQVYDGEARMDVMVRAPERFRDSLQSIRELPVPLPGGGKTTLDRLARIEMKTSSQAVFRENGFRRVGVKFDVSGRDLGSTTAEILDKASKVQVPAGYFVQWSGEYENAQRANQRMMIIIPATMLLLGILLFMLFENLRVVGCILATVFLATVGSLLLLFVRGIPLSVSSSVGLLTLFGLMSLDSVTFASTFMDKLKAQANLTVDVLVSALKESSLERFRPILMNSVLAALGLLPSAFSTSMGSEIQRPLATAVIGGIMTGLPAVMFVLPYFLYTQREHLKPKRER